ncbi:unnamed protein product [Macrosiphum euphorbiae]|uniref:Uncharacterized protein n=1 Tax=Macrosiphum euphorbiae TaxID=13131 RepID=A0AAV0WTZ3_9HEMI|nr:unnamed protein product [Macrosiphum euphorbiae]
MIRQLTSTGTSSVTSGMGHPIRTTDSHIAAHITRVPIGWTMYQVIPSPQDSTAGEVIQVPGVRSQCEDLQSTGQDRRLLEVRYYTL